MIENSRSLHPFAASYNSHNTFQSDHILAPPSTMHRRSPLYGARRIYSGLSNAMMTYVYLGMIFLHHPQAYAESNSLIIIRPPIGWLVQSPSSIELSQQLSVDQKVGCFDTRDLVSAIEKRGGPTKVPKEIRIKIKPYPKKGEVGFALYWQNQRQSERILHSIPKNCEEQLTFVAVALIIALDNAIPPARKQKTKVANKATPTSPSKNFPSEGSSSPQYPANSSKSTSNKTSNKQNQRTDRPTQKSRTPTESKTRQSTSDLDNNNDPKQNKDLSPNNRDEERQSRKRARSIRRQQRQLLRQQQRILRKQLRFSRSRPEIKEAWLYSGGLISFGLLPEIAGGAQADVEMNWSIPLSLRTGLLFSHGSQQMVGHGQANITLAAAEIALCAVANEGRVHANFCLGTSSGPVMARGTSFDENRLDILPWISASGQIRLRINIDDRWGLLVHSAVYMPIVRLRLVIDGESQQRIFFPRLGGMISVGPTLRFAK